MTYKGNKFYTQIRKKDCGPCSIANAISWCGVKYNYRTNYYLLTKKLRFNPSIGCTVDQFIRFFKKSKLFKKNEYIINPKKELLIKHLNNGGSFIFLYKTKVDAPNNHAALVIDYTSSGFRTINHIVGVIMSDIKEDMFDLYLNSECGVFLLEKHEFIS